MRHGLSLVCGSAVELIETTPGPLPRLLGGDRPARTVPRRSGCRAGSGRRSGGEAGAPQHQVAVSAAPVPKDHLLRGEEDVEGVDVVRRRGRLAAGHGAERAGPDAGGNRPDGTPGVLRHAAARMLAMVSLSRRPPYGESEMRRSPSTTVLGRSAYGAAGRYGSVA